jgi:hypothetical protein
MDKAKARYGSRANLPSSNMETGELLWTTDRGTMWAATGGSTHVPIVPEVDALAELTSASLDLAADLLLVHDASAAGQKEKHVLLSQLLLAVFASPVLTGNPTAPTQPVGNSSTRLATTAFVQAALAALVDSSPAALDTLNELAAALGDDPNFATTVTNALAGKAAVAQEAWQTPTLLNSWVNFGAPYTSAAYYKDTIGVVRLKGMVKSGTTTTVMTLPVGYRPDATLRFASVYNGAFGYVQVDSSGNVTASGAGGAIPLECIQFRAA